jgi:hypothetical protein
MRGWLHRHLFSFLCCVFLVVYVLLILSVFCVVFFCGVTCHVTPPKNTTQKTEKMSNTWHHKKTQHRKLTRWATRTPPKKTQHRKLWRMLMKQCVPNVFLVDSAEINCKEKRKIRNNIQFHWRMCNCKEKRRGLVILMFNERMIAQTSF